MDSTSLLNYIGISGGSMAILSTIVYFIRKSLRSKCVKNNDGSSALQISFNNDEIQSIQSNPQLKDMFLQLKSELLKQATNTPSASTPNSRTTPVISVPV